MKIAILDDSAVILTDLTRLLRQAGHECVGFDRGKALLDALRQTHYDMFVLDWNLPDVSGLTVLEWIRNHIGPTVPVLLLTSRNVEEDIVEGLSAGADDYVCKPFQPAVLQARVMAFGRRTQATQSDAALEHYGNFTFDLRSHTVRCGDQDAILTAKEYQLALLLFRNVGRAISRQYVLETIWGLRADIPTRTLDSHIARIRSKLTLRPGNGYQLISVYGFGYRLEEVSTSA